MSKSNLGQKSKEALQDYVVQIDRRIGEYFDGELEKKFGFNKRQKDVVKQALEHTREYILRPTKRLRSSFVHYGYMLGGKKPDEKVWQAAIGVELVHAGLLMHDDFMDQDDMRRRGPTTHEYYRKIMNNNLHYGESMAVTLGDTVMFLGLELIADIGNIKATKQMLRGIANTGFGQAFDVTLEAFMNWTEEDVIVLHKAKTAIYTYENPLFIGGRLAGLPEEAFGILHDYAMDGGVAFQLQDDILGVYGKPEKTGKSADSDLKQGKCTLLVLIALQKGSEEQKKKILKVWGDWTASRDDLDAAKMAIKDCGSYEYNRKLASEYAAKAAKTAEKLRRLNLNTEAADYIQGIAEYMVEREV